MPDRLFRLYQRKRIINVNANIAAAGLLSTVLVMALLWLLKHPLEVLWPTWGFTVFSLVADLLLDGAIFLVLHWVANHWRPLKGRSDSERRALEAAPPPFAHDSVLISVERAVISPLYYLIAAAGTELLQRWGWPAYWAVAVAYPLGLLATRTVHTIWGMRSGTLHDHSRRGTLGVAIVVPPAQPARASKPHQPGAPQAAAETADSTETSVVGRPS